MVQNNSYYDPPNISPLAPKKWHVKILDNGVRAYRYRDGGDKISGSERCLLHEDLAQNALDRSVVEKTTTSRLTEGYLGSRRPLRVLPLTPSHRRLRLEWCRTRGDWSAVEWNQIVFSDESRFNLSSDDNRVCVWRPCGERLNPAFAYSDAPLPQLV
ncbi:transposable element Tcb2 transposase [Trichonephila clavipes]|nr:transposable element Tcb2 transposase [Trichonephila clavipes]